MKKYLCILSIIMASFNVMAEEVENVNEITMEKSNVEEIKEEMVSEKEMTEEIMPEGQMTSEEETMEEMPKDEMSNEEMATEELVVEEMVMEEENSEEILNEELVVDSEEMMLEEKMDSEEEMMSEEVGYEEMETEEETTEKFEFVNLQTEENQSEEMMIEEAEEEYSENENEINLAEEELEELIIEDEKEVEVAKSEKVEEGLFKTEKSKERYIRLRVGGSGAGELKTATTELDTEAGVEFAFEGAYRLDDYVEIGAGVGFQGHGNIKQQGTYSSFYSVPVYVSVKYNILKMPFYVKGQGGLSINEVTDDFKVKAASGLTNPEFTNGYYYGFGIGVDLMNFEVEGLYSMNTVSFKHGDPTAQQDSGRIKYGRISLSVSYKFEVE